MERRFQLVGGAVQVDLEHGDEPEDIVPVLSEALAFARASASRALLVVSGAGDPATPETVSSALEALHAAGAPGEFRVAFVACTYPQYSTYHFAERYAQRFGIVAKVLVSVRDAKEWLAAAPSGAAAGSAGDRSPA